MGVNGVCLLVKRNQFNLAISTISTSDQMVTHDLNRSRHLPLKKLQKEGFKEAYLLYRIYLLCQNYCLLFMWFCLATKFSIVKTKIHHLKLGTTTAFKFSSKLFTITKCWKEMDLSRFGTIGQSFW